MSLMVRRGQRGSGVEHAQEETKSREISVLTSQLCVRWNPLCVQGDVEARGSASCFFLSVTYIVHFFWSFIEMDVKIRRTAFRSSHSHFLLCHQAMYQARQYARFMRPCTAAIPGSLLCCSQHSPLIVWCIDGTHLRRSLFVGPSRVTFGSLFFLSRGDAGHPLARHSTAIWRNQKNNNNAHNNNDHFFVFWAQLRRKDPASLLPCR